MRLPFLISVCLTLATLTLSAEGREFSHSRDLPPLKLAATDLDTILLKTHALIAAANGPLAEQESARESVKLGVRGHEIEIPHFSLASSVAFPREVFRFSSWCAPFRAQAPPLCARLGGELARDGVAKTIERIGFETCVTGFCTR
jgi:hypothetical protein